MYTIVQFSPTGNSAYVGKLLAEELHVEKLHALEHTDPKSLEGNGHLIIIFAIHAFNAPSTVKRFIKNLPKNKFENISLIGVGCNTSWINMAATKNIRHILEKKSYNIVVDTVVAMPLTLVMSFPDTLIEEQLNGLNTIIKDISRDMRELVKTKKTIPFKTKIIQKVGYIEPHAAHLFGLELHAKKSCTKCGLCVKECPEHNIRMNNNDKIKFGFKCMMCMRCIYNCPVNAITPRISKFIPIKGGYSLDAYIDRNE